MPPKLSIGLPCFNAGRFLTEAVQSILAQSFQDWELLIVDDGSNDGSVRGLNAIVDPRIRVLSDGVHRRLAARLNEIVRLSRGKYIARMDADDLSHPQRFELQLDFLDAHREIDGVGCALISFDRDNRVVGHRTLPADMPSIIANPMAGIRVAHATFCARREWFEAHPYNEQNVGCEDWELWQSSYRASCFANLSEPLYFYREFDSFSLSKYLRSKARMTSLQWAMREEFGMRKAATACGQNLAAAAAYSLATLLGLKNQLIARRSDPPSPELRREFEQALKQLRAQPLATPSQRVLHRQ